MKLHLIILFIFVYHLSSGQIKSGYDKNELREMSAVCCSYTFLNLYGSDEDIIPDGYKKVYTSDVQGLDNIFQVYTVKDLGIINFRGSTKNTTSWLENLYASMIPARGTIDVSEKHFDYCFALDSNASVHGGYALEMAYLHDDLIKQVKKLNDAGIYDIFLTGHSQGGALAQMFRAYIELNGDSLISPKNTFKTYTFASPKVGNYSFAKECENRYNDGTHYNIINPEDLVPTFPPTFQDSTAIKKTDLKTLLLDPESIDLKRQIGMRTAKAFEGTLKRTVHRVGGRAHDRIDKKVDDIETPEEVDDVNYIRLNEIRIIDPVEYPKVMIDSSLLENNDSVKNEKRDGNGHFIDDELYRKEPMFYQHKPYNYYVSILKTYFPQDYKKLEKKYLSENL